MVRKEVQAERGFPEEELSLSVFSLYGQIEQKRLLRRVEKAFKRSVCGAVLQGRYIYIHICICIAEGNSKGNFLLLLFFLAIATKLHL